jgi:hypothetical protein
MILAQMVAVIKKPIKLATGTILFQFIPNQRLSGQQPPDSEDLRPFGGAKSPSFNIG